MEKLTSAVEWQDMKTDRDGLVPCIAQDIHSGQVLMLAYMNREAYEKTLETGLVTYWSRSRKELWTKGLTSGHVQYLRELYLDCDNDTILAKVEQVGAACHTGHRTCFYTPALQEAPEWVDIYDDHGRFTGEICDRRSYFLQKGQYMMYVLALIETPEHKFLITQRSMDKKWAAGCWEVSGGGAQAGETSLQAVIREVREETGLDVSACTEDFQPVYRYFNEDLERGDNYFVDIYHFRLSFSAEDISLEHAEATAGRLATMEEIGAMHEKKAFLHYERILQALAAEQDASMGGPS